jgi:hypothetical protein
MAIDHWRHFLQTSPFIILTDQQSLTHLDDQKLSTPWQHKALTKLMGMTYKIIYKKGTDNKVADALSRLQKSPVYDISAISVLKPLWLEDIQKTNEQDPNCSKLLTELAISSPSNQYSLQDGLIKYKGSLWIGNSQQMQQRIMSVLHKSPMGGHSSSEVTYKKVKQLFAWPKLK